MVVEVCKGLVGLPYVALDVIIELGGCARKGPEMGFVGLGCGGLSEVVDPFLVEDSLDVEDAVSFEGLDLFLGDFVFLGCGDSGFDAVGEGDLRILQAEVVFP